MPGTLPTAETPATPRESRGLVVIAGLTLAVAGWLWSQRAVEEQRPASDDAPAATPLAGFRDDAWFLPDDEQLGFVEIPAGPFAMGSDPGRDPLAYENERWSNTSTRGIVDQPRFYLGRFEVTVAQFRAFVAATEAPVDPQSLVGDAGHPVGSVSWPDALAYCRWLETVLREWSETPAPIRELLDDGWRLSLPSEAEWEKGARGTDGRIFPWGDEPRADRANYRGAGVTRVGSFACPECPYGLADMSGNVWELTRSPYRSYPFDPSLDSVDLDADALWVMRGGSYGDPEQNVRAAIRGGADPGARRPFIGFRVALVPGSS